MTSSHNGEAAALRVLDQAFDLIFDVGPLAMARVDREFNFVRVNQRFCDLIGCFEDELADLGFADFLHPDDLEANQELAERGFRGEIPYYEIETRYIKKSGGIVWVKMTATYLKNETGDIINGLAMIEDITARKETQERVTSLNEELEGRVAELEASNEALEQANKELEAFSANVSHDLKGPLVSIAQFSQILLSGERGALNEGQDELARRLRNAGSQAKHIIDDLRDLADVTRREIFAEEIDMASMCWGIIEDLRILAPERDVTFKVRPDLRAYADPALVRLLMVNLIQNAWKYTAPRDHVTIEIGAEVGPVRTAYFVKDNGIGFDNTHREKIFEVFERLHTDEFTGTGLGLATARRIVRRHGGDIWADGDPNVQATFWFSL
jgi:PAS domain S-box-containing protein